MGAEVSVSQNKMPPPPSLQPGYEWNSMVAAAASEADLIVDLAVGYAEFMAEAVNGAPGLFHRVTVPADTISRIP